MIETRVTPVEASSTQTRSVRSIACRQRSVTYLFEVGTAAPEPHLSGANACDRGTTTSGARLGARNCLPSGQRTRLLKPMRIPPGTLNEVTPLALVVGPMNTVPLAALQNRPLCSLWLMAPVDQHHGLALIAHCIGAGNVLFEQERGNAPPHRCRGALVATELCRHRRGLRTDAARCSTPLAGTAHIHDRRRCRRTLNMASTPPSRSRST